MSQAEEIDYCLTQVFGCQINRVKNNVAYVLEVYSKNKSLKFNLKAGMHIIGRDKTCDIQILDTSLSRQHALIEIVEEGVVFIQDLGSVNRTFRNRIELRTKVMYELTAGTELNFGVVRAKFMDCLQSPEFEDNYSDHSIKLDDGNADLSGNISQEQNKLSMEIKTNEVIMTSTPARKMREIEEFREREMNSDLFDEGSTPVDTNDSSVIIAAHNTFDQKNFDDTDILDQSNNIKSDLVQETSKLGMLLYEVMGNTEMGEIAPQETEVIEESYPVYEISEEEETNLSPDEKLQKKRQITAKILDGFFNSEIAGVNNDDAETVLDHNRDSEGDKDSDLISETDLEDDEEDKEFTVEVKKQSQHKLRRNFDYLGPRLLGRLSQNLKETDQEICRGPVNTQEQNDENEKTLENEKENKIVDAEKAEVENIAYLDSWNEIFTQVSLEKSWKEEARKGKANNQGTENGKSNENTSKSPEESVSNSNTETRTSLCEEKGRQSSQETRKTVSEEKILKRNSENVSSSEEIEIGFINNSKDIRNKLPSDDIEKTNSDEKSPISSEIKRKSEKELLEEDRKVDPPINDAAMELFKNSEEKETENMKSLGEENHSEEVQTSKKSLGKRGRRKSKQDSTKEIHIENTRQMGQSTKDVEEENTKSKIIEEMQTNGKENENHSCLNRKEQKNNSTTHRRKSKEEISDKVLKVNIEKIDCEMEPFRNSEENKSSEDSLFSDWKISKPSGTEEIITCEIVIDKPRFSNKRGTRGRSKIKRVEDGEETPNDKSNEEVEISNPAKGTSTQTMALGMEIFRYSEENETKEIKLPNKKRRNVKSNQKMKGGKSKKKKTKKDIEDEIIQEYLKDSLDNLTQVVRDEHWDITSKSDDDLFYEQATQTIDSDTDSVFVSTQVIQDENRANNAYSSHMFSQIATQVLPETRTTSRKSEEDTFRKPLTTEVRKTPKNRSLKNRRSTKSLSNENNDLIEEIPPIIKRERKMSSNPEKQLDIFEFKNDDDDDFLQEIDIKIDVPVQVKKEKKKKTFGKEITNSLTKTIAVDIDEEQIFHYENQTKKRNPVKREKLENNGDNKENVKKERMDGKDVKGISGKKRRNSNRLSGTQTDAPKERELRRSLRIVKDIDCEMTSHNINLPETDTSKIVSLKERNLSTSKKRGRPKKNSLEDNDTYSKRTICKEELSDESQSITKSKKVSGRLNSVKGTTKKKPKSERTEEPKSAYSMTRKRGVKNELNDCPCPVKKATNTQSSSGEVRHAQRLEMQSQLDETLVEYHEPVCRSVMFTGLSDTQFKKTVEKLGANISDDIPRVSHLVTDQVRRTMKFLCCLTMGVPIVSPAWLKASQKSNKFVASAPYIVTKNSNAFKINLQSSIKLAQHYQKLAGGIMAHHRCIVFVTDNTRPDPCQLEQIISCAGGKMLLIQDVSFYEHLNDSESKHICIADSEITKTKIPDLSDRFRALQERNIEILSVEFLLAMIMEQKWPEPENFRINL